MIRGDIWTYQGIARVRRVLVVSADELNGAGLPITVEVTDVRPSGDRAMLAVELPANVADLPGALYVLLRPLHDADPKRFGERIGFVPDDVMESVSMGLRAALDL